MIVRETEPITLIGGAPVESGHLDAALRLASVVVAADGGADTALAAGLMPRAVIGDFDSISDAARARLPEDIQHPMDDQDTTDFEKCLGHVAAPLLIGLGFMGDRLDHHMAACNALVRHAAQRCILMGGADLMFLCPPSLSLPLAEGCRISLFPMGAVEGASDGLRWPIGGMTFSPDGRVGTSNLAQGPVSLSMTAPKMLVMLPADTLGTVAGALRAAPARWSPA
jgi:thiamine pyrophosphokinase